MDQALFDRYFVTYGKLIADWAYDRSNYHYSDLKKVAYAQEQMPSLHACKSFETQWLIKSYILAGLPFEYEHCKFMSEREIENPYILRLRCADFTSITATEELMISYCKTYEKKAHDYCIELLETVFPDENIIYGEDEYSVIAYQEYASIDETQEAKTTDIVSRDDVKTVNDDEAINTAYERPVVQGDNADGKSEGLVVQGDSADEDADDDPDEITPIKNYYLDPRAQLVERYNPCYKKIRMKHPVLCGLVAPTGTGKTNLLFSL